jgi:hypothetical protein
MSFQIALDRSISHAVVGLTTLNIDEVALQVLGYLAPKDLLRTTWVCRRFKNLIHHEKPLRQALFQSPTGSSTSCSSSTESLIHNPVIFVSPLGGLTKTAREAIVASMQPGAPSINQANTVLDMYLTQPATSLLCVSFSFGTKDGGFVHQSNYGSEFRLREVVGDIGWWVQGTNDLVEDSIELQISVDTRGRSREEW